MAEFTSNKDYSGDKILFLKKNKNDKNNENINIDFLSSEEKIIVGNLLNNIDKNKKGMIPLFIADRILFLNIIEVSEKTKDIDFIEKGEILLNSISSFNLEKIGIDKGNLTEEQFLFVKQGVLIGDYKFESYKGKEFLKDCKNIKKIKECIFIESNSDNKDIISIAEGIKITKDIINNPPSDMRPSHFSEAIKDIFKTDKNIEIEIIEKKKLEEMQCGGILGVSRGSSHDPKMVILRYNNSKKDEKPVVLVGKGVTFDTGGYNTKGRFMRWMKQDLGGAATALGSFYALTKLNIKKNIIAVLPIVDNVISADSYLPDDVLKMYNGVTVEIDNTDAEGRLILADALSYTCDKLNPSAIVDMATLTGACAYAVGEDITAVLGSKNLVDKIQDASEKTGEMTWELPLYEKYKKFLKSFVADIKNCSKLKPGTIEAALFLSYFVKKDIPWLHMDIASVAFNEGKECATGKNIRLLVELVKNI